MNIQVWVNVLCRPEYHTRAICQMKFSTNQVYFIRIWQKSFEITLIHPEIWKLFHSNRFIERTTFCDCNVRSYSESDLLSESNEFDCNVLKNFSNEKLFLSILCYFNLLRRELFPSSFVFVSCWHCVYCQHCVCVYGECILIDSSNWILFSEICHKNRSSDLHIVA